jgi:hypothetical protein
MTDEEYKTKVLDAKDVVTQMINNAKEKNIPGAELENDIEEFLQLQGLTEFDLQNNGERQEVSYYKAFTNSFNTRFMEILKATVPEIVDTLDVRKFTIWDMEKELERSSKLKGNVEQMIEDMFVKQIIPQLDPLIDKGYNAQTLGERMADQAGEDLMNFLPMMVAPSSIAVSGPAQGYKLLSSDPSKLKNFFNGLNNSVRSIINQYVNNPGKSVLADAAAIGGFAAGAELGESLTEAARANESEGYMDTGILETGLGLGGATVAAGTALTLSSPKKTVNAAGNVFKNWFGLKPLISSLTRGNKKRQEEQAIKFIKETLEEPKVQENLETSRKLDQVTDGKLSIYNKDSDSGLTLAERTEAPSLTTTQTDIEAKLTGTALDNAANRRINNIQILDDTINKQIPESDKNVSYILDLKKNQFNKTSQKIEEEIAVKEEALTGATESLIPGVSAKESGANLRTIIDNTQSGEATIVLDSLNKIPTSKYSANPEILNDLVTIASSREFQAGTSPTSINRIKSLLDSYLPTQQPILDDTGTIIGTETIPPIKNFTNQDIFDIWLTLGKEESSLLGKSGIENTIKLTKLSEMRELLFNQLKSNLQKTQGDLVGNRAIDKFFGNLNNYVDNFEKGVIVKTQSQTNTGFQLRDEAVADAFFQANNVDSMNTFIRVFGQNEDAVINMQNSILDRIINKTLDPKTGLINVDKLNRFLTQHRTVLDSFNSISPEFVSMVRNTPETITNIATRLNTLNQRKNYVQGQKLNQTFSYLGQPGTKQLKFSSADEYVSAALNDPKVMERIAKEAIENDAGEAWVQAVLNKFKDLRVDMDTGAIGNIEIKNLNNFLKTNEKSLKKLFETMGPEYKNHYNNLTTIMKGFEKINLIAPPKGSPAPTPGQAMKDALGTDVPQVWSRAFAVASGRTGYKFVAAEVFQRYLNTVGKKHFDKVIQEAIYSPELNATLAKLVGGGEATVKDIKNLYGSFAKIMGTVGTVSENADPEYSINDEALSMIKEIDSINTNRTPIKNVDDAVREIPLANLGVPMDVSRLGQTNITPPVSMAAADPNTMDRGKQLFGGPREITFASKGGIMNARKIMQRVI